MLSVRAIELDFKKSWTENQLKHSDGKCLIKLSKHADVCGRHSCPASWSVAPTDIRQMANASDNCHTLMPVMFRAVLLRWLYPFSVMVFVSRNAIMKELPNNDYLLLTYLLALFRTWRLELELAN